MFFLGCHRIKLRWSEQICRGSDRVRLLFLSFIYDPSVVTRLANGGGNNHEETIFDRSLKSSTRIGPVLRARLEPAS